ncbi:MAG TPA: WecB/TagA/CpsF family glycosyltransferase [Candidatus Dormibacteraeota bacterium]|nr:WecB/TagA/CpsF family glycosyltransferase [Candidatus Dormibacteraeota bacterium]
MTRFTLLGVPVDPITQQQAVDWVAQAIAERRPRVVISVNPERIMQAGRDPQFAAVLRAADLALADGVGVEWAARRLGHPLPERIPGVDFVQALAARGARDGWRFFFLGGAPGVAAAAADALKRRAPGFSLAGNFGGSPRALDDEATVAAVRASRAQVVLLAYGGGAEEAWLARNLERSGATVGMGVGGAFDFISGRARRAPPWMRRHGVEWLHRLTREPWRWRRMLALPRFAARVLLERS